MSAAEAGELNDPNAMALSTVDRNGMPNARIVLLKSIEDGGFVFYTNYESTKAQEAFEAGVAPKVVLEATHMLALEFCNLADLRAHAIS